ncbi:type II toxin-antitoxin system death-on-curing family toxin [Prosthecomicrobium sp. N25]|uniref:type II toxin-antitoxin system death-on-curing family toxin n=1 Tax=Prosthecomicrobium sp. N25 TaxID=3129254 RepID=UPI0030774705
MIFDRVLCLERNLERILIAPRQRPPVAPPSVVDGERMLGAWLAALHHDSTLAATIRRHGDLWGMPELMVPVSLPELSAVLQSTVLAGRLTAKRVPTFHVDAIGARFRNAIEKPADPKRLEQASMPARMAALMLDAERQFGLMRRSAPKIEREMLQQFIAICDARISSLPPEAYQTNRTPPLPEVSDFGSFGEEIDIVDWVIGSTRPARLERELQANGYLLARYMDRVGFTRFIGILHKVRIVKSDPVLPRPPSRPPPPVPRDPDSRGAGGPPPAPPKSVDPEAVKKQVQALLAAAASGAPAVEQTVPLPPNPGPAVVLAVDGGSGGGGGAAPGNGEAAAPAPPAAPPAPSAAGPAAEEAAKPTIEWLEAELVVEVHDEQMAKFGGSPGLRDMGLLESALGRPMNKHAYEGEQDPAALAAAYAFGIAQNHPFVDGNKRTAFMSIVVFLGLNGVDFKVPESEATAAIQSLAEGTMDEAGLARWIREGIGSGAAGRPGKA